MPHVERTYKLEGEAATLALGARLADYLAAGDVVALRGDLGAGKTTLARGLIRAISGETDVPSPTYTLIQTYDTDTGELWHGDMYRLERPEDAYELGLLDAFEDCICLIEWPDKLGDLWPEEAIDLRLTFDGTGRIATLSGSREWIENV